MLDEKSIVVQAWVRAIRKGDVTREDVPNLFNLRDVVNTILDREED